MDTREVKNTNGKIESNEDNSDFNNNEASNKLKRKRRSKNDAEGRSYKCTECGKSYLSQPALTNHKKTKHGFGANGEKKGRGRPRKNPPIPPPNDNAEKKFYQFFEKDIRKSNGELIDLEYANECFKDIFGRYSQLFENFTSHQDHSFFKTLTNHWNTPIEDIKNNPQVNCDEIFLIYLKDVASQTNKEFFHFIFKFGILFRECINKLRKSDANATDLEYTQTANAETVPDTCNEFITDFMDPNDYYGLDTSELIEAIQHLCYWLYVNHYTTSRLTLL